MSLVIIWDGMQAMRPMGSRDTDPVQWVPLDDDAAPLGDDGDGTHVSRRTWAKGSARGVGGPVREGTVTTRVAKVEPCECGTMKPAGARYHGAMLREMDGMRCPHDNTYWSACSGRVPPPCCWCDWRVGPTGATPRDAARARLDAFEQKNRKNT